jgi:single-stranded-DNA-specific exonuclease
MKAEWKVAERAPQDFLRALSDLHPLTAQTLFARGYQNPNDARAFLKGEVSRVDPFSLKDMPVAVERINRAIANKERIAVYGDYDCDGVTACALLMRVLLSLGANAQAYIPNRFEEGYGLNEDALITLQAQGIRLVITVDCGARARREAAHASRLGLDLIITDHHELDRDIIPEALAVINPKRAEGSYAFKFLAGVGVAFRLAQCLIRESKNTNSVKEKDLLDLVAIGTVADIVPLTDQNRALVRAGIAQMNSSPRVGIRELMRVAAIRNGGIDAGKIGFALAPRLNAAGRLESAFAAYELLMCEDAMEAERLAQQLNLQNEQRQVMTASVARDAESKTVNVDGAKPALLFAASDEYNAGVIGLAAARLLEKHYRPAIVVSICDGEARGSCRSVRGFNITNALDECREFLSKHGGHAAAAGFTTTSNNLEPLRERLTEIAEREQPSGGWQRVIHADAELDLSQLDWKAFDELRQLEPHGMGNPKPTFVARNAIVANARRIGKAEPNQPAPHLQLRLKDNRRVVWEAVSWRNGDRIGELQANEHKIDIAFQLDMNEWNGEKRLQLVVQDFVRTEI